MKQEDNELTEKLDELFDQNCDRLQAEGGARLTDYAIQLAREQVHYYYRKLKRVADKVTETEIRLTLPNQTTKKDRHYTIEGVVDIVKEDDEIWMYDIKTHDLDYVNAHKDQYEGQLNVYAHIWQKLRGQKLDHSAIISTNLPKSFRNAIKSGEKKQISTEYDKWDPVVPIDFTQDKVKDTIDDFGKTVDAIEDRCFVPPKPDKLGAKIEGTHRRFVTVVCSSCDARYSCKSFREYLKKSQSNRPSAFLKYIEEDSHSEEKDEAIHRQMLGKIT